MHVNPLHTLTVVADICLGGAATVAVGSATVAVGGGVSSTVVAGEEPATVVAWVEPATVVAEGGEAEPDWSCKSWNY